MTIGADSGGRTHTMFPSKDFGSTYRLVLTMRLELIHLSVPVLEAGASANSATSGYTTTQQLACGGILTC